MLLQELSAALSKAEARINLLTKTDVEPTPYPVRLPSLPLSVSSGLQGPNSSGDVNGLHKSAQVISPSMSMGKHSVFWEVEFLFWTAL